MIVLTHVYFYSADEYADVNGNKSEIADTKVGLGMIRFVKTWHFGGNNQFQYILEGIVSQQNIAIDGTDYASSINMSGICNPII